MFSEQGVLALARVIGTVLVFIVMIVTFGPTINALIRKKLALDRPTKKDETIKYLRDLQLNGPAETQTPASHAPFQFRCPNGHPLEHVVGMAGRTINCSECGVEIMIPSPST